MTQILKYIFITTALVCSSNLLNAGIDKTPHRGYDDLPLIDFTFDSDEAIKNCTVENGKIEIEDGKLVFSFFTDGRFSTPDLKGSRNSVYNPHLEERNTLFVVMNNLSSADKIKISFITEEDSVYDLKKSKVFDIPKSEKMKGVFFNISDNDYAKGRLRGLRFEPIIENEKKKSKLEGRIEIDRITFEQEDKIEPFAGNIVECVTKDGKVVIRGKIEKNLLKQYSNITIYKTSMAQGEDDISKMELLKEIALTQEFSIDDISLVGGEISLLSSQLLAVVKNSDNDFMKISPRFYIENWSDFGNNPYEFELPHIEVDVAMFGAKGDGFSDDTDAIQKAVDYVSQRGGGKVVLSGSDEKYGKRYIATNILLKSNVEFNIGKNAVLWQSQNETDYKYVPKYGHEGVIPGINWTHNMHVSNLPLVQASGAENIKITGPGKIRSLDIESLNPEYGDYRSNCDDRIHVIPIGIFRCRNVEVSNLDIVRTNNYHTAFYGCENVFIGNVKMHEVKCVSGDGMGIGMGTKNVKIERVFLESNDDGVVLWSSYDDPRGVLWWKSMPDNNNSISNVEVSHSYIHSGGGKAIAFIPWGTDNPDQSRQEIDNINVYDCDLQGGYSVGTWPDNPYFGRQPFDNGEIDDYSPVRKVRIYNNVYRSECSLYPITISDIITDCGIKSCDTIQNSDFKNNMSYWTGKNSKVIDNVCLIEEGGIVYQGVWLEKGEHTINVDCEGKGEIFVEKDVEKIPTDKLLKMTPATPMQDTNKQNIVVLKDISTFKPQSLSITFRVEDAGNFYIGAKSKSDGSKEVFRVGKIK
ncbi:MAG: hypothetical protein Q4F97_07175 [Bacteroidales bacterium]|nr:hypothetical protein [Bacteroidales bacterium]